MDADKVFKTDFTDLDSVIELAKQFGHGQVVYKNPDRPNYNITHAARTDLYEPEWVVYKTGA